MGLVNQIRVSTFTPLFRLVAEKQGLLFKAQPAQPRRYVHAVILVSYSWTRIFLCLSTY